MMFLGFRKRRRVRKESAWKPPWMNEHELSDSSDQTSQRFRSASKDEDRKLPRASSLEYFLHDEHHDVDLNIVRRLTKNMAERGRKVGIHLQAIHDGVPKDESDADGEQYLPEDLADELRKRTTSVDSEIKQLENQMGQLQRTLVKGKARRESIKHRISVSSTSPGGPRKVSAMTPYFPTPENPCEDVSKEDLKARLEALENEKLELVEDKKDLNDEIKFLKYQLQYRLEVQTLQNEKESSSKTESHVKLEKENIALREENKDLKERLTVIRTKLKESGNTEESLLSVTDVSDSEDGRDDSSLESELDRLYTERKILLSSIMRMQNLDRDDYRRDSVSFTDYGVQCDLVDSTGRDQSDGHATPLVAKLREENESFRKSLQEVARENEDMTDENRALDEENVKLVEEKRTLEDTINKLRSQINDTLDTTLDEIEQLHSFNEELEGKLHKTSAHGKELSESLVEFKDKNSKALENLLNDIENKSSVKDILDHIRGEIPRINEENIVFVDTGVQEHEVPMETAEEDKTLATNLLNEVKNCKELLESQRSHIRELQMDKRDIEEGYAKMKRELTILRSNRQKERKKEWLSKRRAKSMNDGLLTNQDTDRSMSEEIDLLKRDIRRLNATKSELDEVIRGIKKDKATLEEEKVCLLGSLYHQLERTESLEVQIEELTAVLEQWEAKADLRDSTSDVFSPVDLTPRQIGEVEDAATQSGTQEAAIGDGKTQGDDDVDEKAGDAVAHAHEEPSPSVQVSEIEDEAAVSQDSIDVRSRKTSTLVNVVDSATEESLHEMKQKIHALGDNLKTVQDSVYDLEVERDKLQEDLEESKKNEKELRNVVIQLKRENSSTKDKLEKANDFAKTLQECLKEAHDEKEDIVESLEEANEEKIVAKKHSELLDSRLKEVTQQRDASKSENTEMKGKYEKAEEKLKEIHKMLDDIGKLAPTLDDSEDIEAEKETDTTNASKDDSEKCIDDLGKEIISWLGTVFVDVDRTRKELKRTNNEQNRLKSRLDTVLTERQALQKYVREIDDKKRQMKMFITKLTEEKEKLAVQIDETRQQKVNLADALEDVYQSKEKLQHRLDEALCKQDQYRNSLLEAVDEAKTLKESLYRMVNEHETMKESLLIANREIGRLKSQEAVRKSLSPEADQADHEEEELDRLEKGQQETEENKDAVAVLKAERDDLQQTLRKLNEVLEAMQNELEKVEKEKEDLAKSANEVRISVGVLSKENHILKSHLVEFVQKESVQEGEDLIAPVVAAQAESTPEDSGIEAPESESTSTVEDKEEVPQSPVMSRLWTNLSLLATENSQLQDKINELQNKNETLHKDLNDAGKEKAEKEMRVEELTSENVRLRDVVSQHMTSKELHADNEQLEEWYDVVCKEKEQLERELESITKENEELLQDIKRLRDEKEQLKTTVEKAEGSEGLDEDDKQSGESDVDKGLREELQRATDEAKQLKDLLENEKQEKESVLQSLRCDLEHKIEELVAQKENIAKENDGTVTSLRVQIEELKQQKENDCNELQADFEKRLEELVENTDKIVQEKVDIIISLQAEIKDKDAQQTNEEKDKSEIQLESEPMGEEVKGAVDNYEEIQMALENAKEENIKLMEKVKELESEFEKKIKELTEEKETLLHEKADLVKSLEASQSSDEKEKDQIDLKDEDTREEEEEEHIDRLDIEDDLQGALDVYQQLKNALEAEKEENETLRENEEGLKALQAQSEKKVDELVAQKDKLVKEKIDLVNSLHERMAEISEEKDKLAEEMQVLLTEKKQETDRLQDERDKALQEIAQLKTSLETFTEDNEVLKRNEHNQEVLKDDTEKRIYQLAAEKETLVKEKAALVNSLHAEKEELTKTIGQLQEERNKLCESFKTTEEDLEASIKEAVALEKQVEMLSRESATMREEAEERIQKLIELEEKVILTMEKKLELAEYAATLKSKKESLEKKCAELSLEVEGLKKSRDDMLAGRSESDKLLTDQVKELSVSNEKNEADLVEVRNALKIEKQDIEVLKIKLGSMDRKNKELNEELSKVREREQQKTSELGEKSGSLDKALKDHEDAQKTSNEKDAKLEEMKEEMRKVNEEVHKILDKNEKLSKLLSDVNAGLDGIIKEEGSSASPEAKLERLKEKFVNLEEQMSKASAEAENSTQEKTKLTGFLDEMDQRMDILIKDDVIERETKKDGKGNGSVDGVNGVLSHEEEKQKPQQSLAKLTSTIDRLKNQLDESFEREKQARANLQRVKEDNMKISKGMKAKSNFLRTMKVSFEKLEQESKQFAKKAAEKAIKIEDAKRLCSELKQEVNSLKNELQESEKSKKEIDSWFTALKREHEALGQRLRSMAVERVELAEKRPDVSSLESHALEITHVELAEKEPQVLESCAIDVENIEVSRSMTVERVELAEKGPDALSLESRALEITHVELAEKEPQVLGSCAIEVENIEVSRSMTVERVELAETGPDALSLESRALKITHVELAEKEPQVLGSCAIEVENIEMSEAPVSMEEPCSSGTGQTEMELPVKMEEAMEASQHVDEEIQEEKPIEDQIVVPVNIQQVEAAYPLVVESLELAESCPDDVDGETAPKTSDSRVISQEQDRNVKAHLEERIVEMEMESNELKEALRQMEDRFKAAENRAEVLEIALSDSKLIESLPDVFGSESGEVEHLKKTIKEREESIGELTEKIHTLEKDNTDAQSQCKETKKRLKERSSSLQNLQEKLGVSRNFMNKVLDENTELKETMASLEKENNEIKDKWEELQKKDEVIRAKFEEVTTEKRDLQSKFAKTEEEVAELKERLVSRKDLMHSLEKDRENFKTSLRESKKEIELLEDRIEYLNEQSINEVKRREEAENLVEKLKATRKQISEELDVMRREKKDIFEESDTTKTDLKQRTKEMEELAKSHTTTCAALDESKHKVEHLTRELRREKLRKDREVGDIKKEKVQLQNDEERSERETTNLRKQLTEEKNRNDKFEKLMETVKAESSELRKSLEKETQEKVKTSKELEGNKREGKRLRTLTGDLNTKITNLEALVKVAKNEKKVFEEEAKRIKAVNTDLRMRIKENVEDKEELEDILGEMREKRKKLNDEIEKALNERDAFEDELIDLKKVTQLEKEAAEKERKRLVEKLEASENPLVPLQSKIKELERKNIQLLRERRDTKKELEGKLQATEKETSPLLSKIETLEKENKDLIKESADLKKDLEQRRKETNDIRKDLTTTEVKVKAFVTKQKKLENQLVMLQKSKADIRTKDIELQKAREEITSLMNKIESMNDKKLTELRMVVHEDIEVVEEKELHASVADRADSAPVTHPDRNHLEDQIANYKRETTRMRRRLEAADNKLMNLREELQRSKEDVRCKDIEVEKARDEITLLMNRIESSNDKKLTELRMVVHEDIEAVEDKELHASVADQTYSVPVPTPNTQQLEDEVTNYKIENMRMNARLEAADSKLMSLQEELYKISRHRVVEEKKLKDKESDSKTLRENLRMTKQEEAKLKKRLETSDETESKLRKSLTVVTREKDAIQRENEILRQRRGSIVEKVMVKRGDIQTASQLPDLDVEPLAKAASMGSARKEIIMLEQHVKDLRSQIRKARDEIFDLTHELSDKERELKQQDRLHQEEVKRLRAEVAELDKENAKLRSELHNATEYKRSKSTFSTVQELKGVNRKAESDMKEVIAKTADLLKRAKEDETGERSEDGWTHHEVLEDNQKMAKDFAESERARERLIKRLKRAEENNKFLKQIVADMVIELDNVQRLVGFYTGVGEKSKDDADEKRPHKQEIVDTLSNLSSVDSEELKISLNDLRAKIKGLEKDLRDQKDQGDRNLQDLLKSRNSKLEAELQNATKEKARAREKLRYMQDQLSKILAERRVIQDIGTDTRRELQTLIDCLTTEREEKEEITSEYSELQRKLRETERSELALKSKLQGLKDETDDVYRRKQKLEQELSDITVHLDVEKKQGDQNMKAASEVEAEYERSRRENYDLSVRLKQVEARCLDGENAYIALEKEHEALIQKHEDLRKAFKEVDNEGKTLIQETHSFKLKMEKRNKELSECLEGKELEAISLRAKHEGLSSAVKKLEGHIRSLERDKEVLHANAVSAESKISNLELINREQQHEVQELILQKSRENFVGEQLEKLFYENTRIKEQKKMLVARIEVLERNMMMETHTRKASESDQEDLLIRLDKQQEETKRAVALTEHWRKLLEKQEEEAELQIDALSLLVEKLRREKEDDDKKGTSVDQIKEDHRRLQEENAYLRDLLNKTTNDAQDLKKEVNLLRRACQQLKQKRSGSTVGSRGSSFSSTTPAAALVVNSTASGRSSTSSLSRVAAPPNAPSGGGMREITISTLTVPRQGYSSRGEVELRSSSFDRSSPEGSERIIESSSERVVESFYRHSTPVVESNRSRSRSPHSPRSPRRNGDIAPAEAISLQSSEGSVCSREFYCSPILTAVDNCPVHRHSSSGRGPSHCPICKKDKTPGGRGQFVLENYV